MISKEDRMYFIDPLQPSAVRKTKADGSELPLEILALRYRRDNFKQDRIGTVIPVTHQRVDNNELWWVDADGDYVYGAQLSDRGQGRTDLMAIVDDDLFYVGRNGGEHYNGSSAFGSFIVDAKRSDGKRLPGRPGSSFTYLARRVIKAAPWASTLMPVPGDTQEVIDAKVARAKQRYIQRRKKGEIYKEGLRRDWLHHLERLRPDHDLPTPRFHVGVEGMFLAVNGDNVAVEDLSETQRDRVAPIRRNAIITPDHGPREGYAQQFVGAPFSVVTTHTVADYSGLRNLSTEDVRYGVFDALRVHSGHVVETNRYAILTSF